VWQTNSWLFSTLYYIHTYLLTYLQTNVGVTCSHTGWTATDRDIGGCLPDAYYAQLKHAVQ